MTADELSGSRSNCKTYNDFPALPTTTTTTLLTLTLDSLTERRFSKQRGTKYLVVIN